MYNLWGPTSQDFMVVCQVSEAEFQLLFDAGALYQAKNGGVTDDGLVK